VHDALYGYTAVAIGNNIVVLGECEDHGYLRSFEAFNVDRYSWEELPEMCQARWIHTAAVV
jgi:hypothetical protein